MLYSYRTYIRLSSVRRGRGEKTSLFSEDCTIYIIASVSGRCSLHDTDKLGVSNHILDATRWMLR